MKKVILAAVLLIVLSAYQTNAQPIYAPNLAGYVGKGTICYPYGFYQGDIYNGFAHGVGFYYRIDGSFYYGGFNGGLYSGQGVLMMRNIGYVNGCWQNGKWIGGCNNGSIPENAVQNIVTHLSNTIEQVQQSSSNTNQTQYQTYSPEGYKITEIDPESEEGKTILGGLK